MNPERGAPNGGAGNRRRREEVDDSLDLVRRAQAGDLEAYEEFFRRYYLEVRAQARARLGPELRREIDSEDAAQEAMVETIRDFLGFQVESRAALVALLTKILEHRLRARARHMHAAKRDGAPQRILDHLRESIASGELELVPADGAPLPPELAASAELRARIVVAMKELDERERELIRLRMNSAQSWEEIAQRLGFPSAGAARMAHARATAALRVAMGPFGRLEGED